MKFTLALLKEHLKTKATVEQVTTDSPPLDGEGLGVG